MEGDRPPEEPPAGPAAEPDGAAETGAAQAGAAQAGVAQAEPDGAAETGAAQAGAAQAGVAQAEPGGGAQAGRRRRDLLLSLPALIVTTAVVGIVSWGVTRLTDGADSLTRDTPPPATVSVETNPRKVGAFGDLEIRGVLPEGATPATGPGKGCTGFHDWLVANAGTDAGESRLQVTVQGNAERQVQIANLRVVVVSREDPPPSVGVSCPTAGQANLRFLTIDLDSPQPRATYTSEDGAPFGFTVESGEIETFLISAKTERALYQWYLELDLVSGDKHTTVRVDNGGKNFRTAPVPATPLWSWDFQSRWVDISSGRTRAVGDRLVPPAPGGEATP
ncbi:hypothetical protein [Kitasatospora sp. NPDC056184]|uniref:hypothetical protein n=1 Tax=Kitasatospora sp. NPDC056184 TaxID=3345738 RepID=UPI0035DAA43A